MYMHVSQVRMQSASDKIYSQRMGCAKYFQQIYREEGLHGLYRVREGVERPDTYNYCIA